MISNVGEFHFIFGGESIKQDEMLKVSMHSINVLKTRAKISLLTLKVRSFLSGWRCCWAFLYTELVCWEKDNEVSM